MEEDAGATLRTSDVAKRLRVSERTVYAYVDRGLIEAVKVGWGLVPRYRFTEAAVTACQERLAEATKE